ncbi:TetR/AcrR family transcriptional regulator [Neisseria sp. WF04]|uniref:TetR/AcrR family transcriptional regulator n=1 Tax=unclassified Neisseria TaxID=2623750 RepID=UPI00210FDFB1|nr:TetR/AcrR family transcriptional regulator [Neisseria sp. WF04]
MQTAIALIAEQGLSASTANIAKQAGVAGGTLFTYFDSKEALFNQAYLSIKADIAAAVSGSGSGDWQQQMRQWWHAYTDWGLRHPRERAAVRQLESSLLLTQQTRQQAREMFAPMWQILDEAERSGRFYLPLDFTVPMMEGMAETAIQHLAAPSLPGQQAAFEMMWRALVKP